MVVVGCKLLYWVESTKNVSQIHWDASTAPVLFDLVPTGQGVHTDAPGVFTKCPALQDSHVVPATNVPFLHTQPDPTGTLSAAQMHWLALDAPVLSVVRPTGHAMQVLSLVSD